MSYIILSHIKDEEKNILDVVTNFYSQTLKPLEVVIVDDDSKDDTIKLLGKFPDIRLLLITQKSWVDSTSFIRRKTAFNFGIDYIKRNFPFVKYVLKVDGDTLISFDYAEKLVNMMEWDNLVACSGMSTEYYKVRNLNNGAVMYKLVNLPWAKPIYGWDWQLETDLIKQGGRVAVNRMAKYTDIRMPNMVDSDLKKVIRNRLYRKYCEFMGYKL